MFSLQNKQILLGVTGGIAAYKSAELVRALKTHGCDVRVAMTAAAQEFIRPLTFQALTGNPVHTSLLDPEAEAGMGHIELARWADLILIAPASADFIARLASGKGDDLLTTVCLASASKLALAPAMNQQMWANPATSDNIETLSARKNIHILGPAAGLQACGDMGLGRMLEPTELVLKASELFLPGSLAGQKMVITAGPTREPIDPVRYLSNHSSGKMGYALAQAAAEAGAQVSLISGPTQLPAPERVETISVTSASEMLAAARQHCDGAAILIAAAAVSDYRPAHVAEQKIKKGSDDTLVLNLVKNPDIVATLTQEFPQLFAVGFAAETEKLEEHAQRKLTQKNLKLVIANDVSNQNIGFNSDNNAVTVISKSAQVPISLRSKQQLARELIDYIAQQLAGD